MKTIKIEKKDTRQKKDIIVRLMLGDVLEWQDGFFKVIYINEGKQRLTLTPSRGTVLKIKDGQIQRATDAKKA